MFGDVSLRRRPAALDAAMVDALQRVGHARERGCRSPAHRIVVRLKRGHRRTIPAKGARHANGCGATAAMDRLAVLESVRLWQRVRTRRRTACSLTWRRMPS